MKNSAVVLAFLFLVASCSQQDSDKNSESVKLFLHPEKGTKKEMNYLISYESPNSKAVFNYRMDYIIETVQSDEKSTELKFSFHKITFDGNIDTANFNIDAASPDSAQSAYFVYAEPYFAILNHQFLVKYDRKFTKLSDEILTKVDSKSLTPPVNRAPFFISLPDSEIKHGSKWKGEIELKSGEGMVVNAEFEVEKIEKNIVWVRFSGKVDGKGENFELSYSLQGDVTGTAKIDLENGLPIQSEMVQKLNQKMGEKESPINITIKQNIK